MKLAETARNEVGNFDGRNFLCGVNRRDFPPLWLLRACQKRTGAIGMALLAEQILPKPLPDRQTAPVRSLHFMRLAGTLPRLRGRPELLLHKLRRSQDHPIRYITQPAAQDHWGSFPFSSSRTRTASNGTRLRPESKSLSYRAERHQQIAIGFRLLLPFAKQLLNNNSRFRSRSRFR